MAYVQKPPSNAYTGISSGARGLIPPQGIGPIPNFSNGHLWFEDDFYCIHLQNFFNSY